MEEHGATQIPAAENTADRATLLDTITIPADLRKLDINQLPQLCREIRAFIVDHIAETGGHFASNLGSVEVAVALHYVFNTPADEIVWDTGHQAYPHKILTGRREAFRTIRQYKGLSGYPTPEESEYDTFPVGHAGTSISVALGMARARDLKNERHEVISVIGDGAMTSGLALEGLNNAHGVKRFLVVLNDNEMSISRTTGAFARHFSKLVSSPRYRKIKHSVGAFLPRVWLVGPFLTKLILRVQGGIKHIIAPQNIFENLGFHYLGPMNGHNVIELVEIMRACREETETPILLHLITKKGKGFEPAECDPESYHGVTPFDKCTGKLEKPVKGVTYTRIFSEVISEMAEKDERIVVVSAAMCGGTGMTDFADKLPRRFVDVGIAEQHAVTFAGGMAARGMRPIVGIYSTFLQRGYDEIEHDVCLPHVPVLFALDRAGLVGSDGKTHHGVFDIAYLRHLPGIQIFMPRDKTAMKKVLEYALAHDGPCAVRYPRSVVPYDIVPGGLPPFGSQQVTTWEILKEGTDVAICAIGHMVFYAYRAAQLLEERGIHACVVDACAIKPLDLDTLQQLTRCYSIVTLEDHVISCGFGSSVAEAVTEQDTVARVLRIGIPDTFVNHGTLKELYTELGWQPEQLAERIACWCKH